MKAVNISDLTGIIEAGELDDLPEVKALTVKIIETEKQKASARPEIVVEPYLELASRLYEAGVPISRLVDMLSADLRVSISDTMLRGLLSERKDAEAIKTLNALAEKYKVKGVNATAFDKKHKLRYAIRECIYALRLAGCPLKDLP